MSPVFVCRTINVLDTFHTHTQRLYGLYDFAIGFSVSKVGFFSKVGLYGTDAR
eukprot:COSAG06_NODE_5144_length_3683_cov_2.517299_3_plen_53_part_00